VALLQILPSRDIWGICAVKLCIIFVEKLRENAELFERQSKRLEQKIQWQHHKLWIILAVIVTLIILFLVLAGKG